ncbi:ATP-binding protein [Pseudanabaena mucicola]|uniref:histidine kinase n=1 Tax=Pseudanabaena mucicola FACHB-723 TaxID=2692860 RepID=A0ABR7ZUE1_9CYAN|nr:ATP-binding protein [Pseudanabaena mucicola]MBD2187601.1 response regulator [Pseudanabaena mucicola FACHB-723]
MAIAILKNIICLWLGGMILGKNRKLSLKFILISQFVTLIVGISGLAIWLAWRSEQETVTNLVKQLQTEISDRIQQKLTTYLETPHLINQINADAIKQGALQPQGQLSEKYLWRQIQRFPKVSWIYYGGEKTGEFIGINRLNSSPNDPLQGLTLAVNINGLQRYYFSLDQQGNRLKPQGSPELYDARQRPWYRAAINSRKPIWSEIYQDSALPEQVISASLAVFNAQGERIGVLGADLSLANISVFLKELQIGKSGQALIFEPSGLLVASSVLDNPYANNSDRKQVERLAINSIQQPMIRASVQHLEKELGGLSQITTAQNIKFASESGNIFLKVLPYRDERGIEWLIAVVVPESDFTEQLNITQQTFVALLCLVLAAAIVLVIITTDYINRSLQNLTLASQNLASGDLDREIPPAKFDELNQLSHAFNQMARQLKYSFASLASANENLELRIQERITELQTSDAKFKSLVRNLSGIVYRAACDRNSWDIVFMGGAVKEITGYPESDFINNCQRTWFNIIHPDDQQHVEHTINDSLECCQPYSLEYRIIDAESNIRHLCEKGQGLFDKKGDLLWLDGVIFDISDRKQVEAELLDRVHLSILVSEIGSASTQLNRLEDVLQSFVESLWRHLDVDFAQIWTINAGATDIELQISTGKYSATDSERLRHLVSPDKIWAIMQGEFQPLLTDQIVADLSEADQLWLQENEINSLVGYPLLVKGRGVGVLFLVAQSHLDTDIQMLDLIANAIAIGIDHKQSEDRLRIANAEMKALFAAMDEVILVRDRQGIVRKIPQTRRDLGWLTPDQVIGKLPEEIFSTEQAKLITLNVQKVIEKQQTLNLEYSLTQNNQLIWWNASISPIDAETVIWVARDITKGKQIEQQLKQAKHIAESASQAKGQFLASMSHELRTPLNAILGFTQLMIRDSSIQDKHRSYLKIIHNSGDHLLELINDVLDMSKIEAGQITLNIGSFDLYYLLDTLEKMFRIKVDDKSLQLLFQRSADTPRWINTDEGKLRQILINLLSNAIKFTEHGSVHLTVELTNISEHGLNPDLLATASTISVDLMALKFSVKDTGQGIPSDYLEKIFDAFEQTDIGKLSAEGTGLGLAISRRFAELMGGKITVQSKLQEGSSFDVYLPVGISAVPVPARTVDERYVIGLAPNQPEYRILVAEDRWESRHLLVKLLESVGFQVKDAENGLAAIAIWEEWQPHLIWMDMRMPIMDGYEATRRIKSHLQGQATVIIALTASALEEEKVIILSAGCDDFVRKPFQETVIFDKLAEYLGVTYVYQDDCDRNAMDQDYSDPDTLTTNLQIHLPEMPDIWLQKLQQAATLADNDLIHELIKEIPSNNTVLIQSLLSLIDNFCYNQIIELTQKFLVK